MGLAVLFLDLLLLKLDFAFKFNPLSTIIKLFFYRFNSAYNILGKSNRIGKQISTSHASVFAAGQREIGAIVWNWSLKRQHGREGSDSPSSTKRESRFDKRMFKK